MSWINIGDVSSKAFQCGYCGESISSEKDIVTKLMRTLFIFVIIVQDLLILVFKIINNILVLRLGIGLKISLMKT